MSLLKFTSMPMVSPSSHDLPNGHCRNSHRRCFVKKAVTWSFANFIGKHLCWSLSFRPATLLKETPTQVFPHEIWEDFKKTYFENICERLLLSIVNYQSTSADSSVVNVKVFRLMRFCTENHELKHLFYSPITDFEPVQKFTTVMFKIL